MNPIIRIPLPVAGLHALAGYFTNGPSLPAFHGLVAQIERDAGVPVKSFAIGVQSWDARLDQYVYLPRRDGGSEMSGYRQADAELVLFLQLASDEPVTEASLDALAAAVNRCRVQGGTIAAMVLPRAPARAALAERRMALQVIGAESAGELLGELIDSELPLTRLYLRQPVPDGLAGDELLDHYARAMMDERNVLVCNGYVAVGELAGQRVAEPNFTLAELYPVFELKEVSRRQAADICVRLFWSFDTDLHARHPEFFVLG